MTPELTMFLCTLGGFGLLALLFYVFFLRSDRQDLEELLQLHAKPAKLSYTVSGVHPELEADFRRLNPAAVRWDDFLKAALENRVWSDWHESLRQDDARYAAELAGLVRFIHIRSVPS